MSVSSYRLDGLEPDNLLAFLALLGLLRAIEADDRQRAESDALRPRVSWDVDNPPLRPRLHVAQQVATEELLGRVASGIEALASVHEFNSRKDLNYSRNECRALLADAAQNADLIRRDYIDILSSLMSDAAIKDDKDEPVDGTPLCLLFGQGHQHFLERLAAIPKQTAPAPRGRGKSAIPVSATQCLNEVLFQAWHREDEAASFRWDPEEDVRYALMAGDPTDSAYKTGTQHGANRLAAVGISSLTLVPEARAGRVRPSIIGGSFTSEGFSFAWPIWRDPATLSSIRALLGHPEIRTSGALEYLGVQDVIITRRISVGQFMNFSRGRVARPRPVPSQPQRLEMAALT